MKSGVLDAIREAGGEVFGLTSEPQTLATEAEEDWEVPFPVIGDPHHEIRELCRDEGWLDVFYNEDYGHLRDRSWACHPKGYYQPAVLAVGKDRRVLYRWRCVPKYSNMSGAGSRPEPAYTWQRIQEVMAATGDAEPDRDPVMGGAKDASWPRFLLIMLAHGWFVRPKAFPLGRASDKVRVSPSKMMRRVYLFAAIWWVALIVLPMAWFGLAVLAWLIVMTPGLIEIHRQFQNESDAY